MFLLGFRSSGGGNLTKWKRQEPSLNLFGFASDELDETVQKLLAKTNDLTGFLKTCTDTKSEIKRAGGGIMQLCLKLNRINLNRPMVSQASPSVYSGVQVQPLTKDMQADDGGYTTADSATQTLGEKDEEAERRRAYIRAAINKHSLFDGFQQVADMK
nr:unnamed protein product [Callosobruchus analis]